MAAAHACGCGSMKSRLRGSAPLGCVASNAFLRHTHAARASVRRKHSRTGEAAARRAWQGKINRTPSAKLCKSERGVSPGLVPSTDWLAFRDSACAALTQGAGLHDGFDSGQKDLRRDYRTHLPQPNRRHAKQSCLQPKITLAPAPAVARVLPWPRVSALRHSARGALESARVGPLWPQRPR